MRKVFRNAITQAEAQDLVGNALPLDGTDYARIKEEGANTALWKHPTVARLAEWVSNLCGAAVKGEAYCIVESKADGAITAHTDRSVAYEDGVPQSVPEESEMSWCRFSVACLLSPPDSFEGGEFYFEQPDQTVSKVEHYLGMAVYDSSQIHGVTRKVGPRTTLLLFFV